MTAAPKPAPFVWTEEHERRHQQVVALLGGWDAIDATRCILVMPGEQRCILERGHELPHETARGERSW